MSRELITFFPLVTIEHNFGHFTLKNATWTPYPIGEKHCNPIGDNGYLVGEMVEGYSTDRILNYTHTVKEVPGTIRQVDWCAQSKLYGGTEEFPYRFNLKFY